MPSVRPWTRDRQAGQPSTAPGKLTLDLRRDDQMLKRLVEDKVSDSCKKAARHSSIEIEKRNDNEKEESDITGYGHNDVDNRSPPESGRPGGQAPPDLHLLSPPHAFQTGRRQEEAHFHRRGSLRRPSTPRKGDIYARHPKPTRAPRDFFDLDPACLGEIFAPFLQKLFMVAQPDVCRGPA